MIAWFLVTVMIVILWMIFKRLFISPAERKFEELARECMGRQAAKRHGALTVSNGMPGLTIPYKTATINLAFISNNNELYRECTYAQFRTAHFPDKKFKLLLNSKDFFLKPLAVGTRIEILDDRLREAYVATGNDAAFVNRLLSQEIRDGLLKETPHVKFGRRIEAPPLDRERGWLTVFVQNQRAGDETFDGLIETAILFYEGLEELNRRSDQAKSV
jgi:hypothetical protein